MLSLTPFWHFSSLIHSAVLARVRQTQVLQIASSSFWIVKTQIPCWYLKAPESLIFCKIFVFISEIPGEDDYDVRLTIFISSAGLMGVMKLSVCQCLGQIQSQYRIIGIIPTFCLLASRHGVRSIIRMRCDATSDDGDGPWYSDSLLLPREQ